MVILSVYSALSKEHNMSALYHTTICPASLRPGKANLWHGCQNWKNMRKSWIWLFIFLIPESFYTIISWIILKWHLRSTSWIYGGNDVLSYRNKVQMYRFFVLYQHSRQKWFCIASVYQWRQSHKLSFLKGRIDCFLSKVRLYWYFSPSIIDKSGKIHSIITINVKYNKCELLSIYCINKIVNSLILNYS